MKIGTLDGNSSLLLERSALVGGLLKFGGGDFLKCRGEHSPIGSHLGEL